MPTAPNSNINSVLIKTVLIASAVFIAACDSSPGIKTNYRQQLETQVDNFPSAFQLSVASGTDALCLTDVTFGQPLQLMTCDRSNQRQAWRMNANNQLALADNSGHCISVNAVNAPIAADCSGQAPDATINPISGIISLQGMRLNRNANTPVLNSLPEASSVHWQRIDLADNRLGSQITDSQGLCVTLTGTIGTDEAVVLNRCQPGNSAQQWLVLADQKLRHGVHSSYCLAQDASQPGNANIRLCSDLSSSSWIYQGGRIVDGALAITASGSNLVIATNRLAESQAFSVYQASIHGTSGHCPADAQLTAMTNTNIESYFGGIANFPTTDSRISGISAAIGFSEGSGTSAANKANAAVPVTLSGNAGWGTGFNGIGHSFEMSGSSGSGELVGLETGGPISIGGWINFHSFSQRWSRIWDFGDGVSQHNILLTHREMLNRLDLHLYQSGGGSSWELTEDDFYVANQWDHILLTIDNNRNTRIYRNGQLAVSGTANAVPNRRVRSNNYIGKSNWGSDGYLDGNVDEFVTFDRALSASEVEQLFSLGSVSELYGQPLAKVRVTDAEDNPIAGCEVIWNTRYPNSNGHVYPVAATTDSNGVASAYWVQGNAAEQALLASIHTTNQQTRDVLFRASNQALRAIATPLRAQWTTQGWREFNLEFSPAAITHNSDFTAIDFGLGQVQVTPTSVQLVVTRATSPVAAARTQGSCVASDDNLRDICSLSTSILSGENYRLRLQSTENSNNTEFTLHLVNLANNNQTLVGLIRHRVAAVPQNNLSSRFHSMALAEQCSETTLNWVNFTNPSYIDRQSGDTVQVNQAGIVTEYAPGKDFICGNYHYQVVDGVLQMRTGGKLSQLSSPVAIKGQTPALTLPLN